MPLEIRSYSTDTDRNPMGLGCHIAFVAVGLTRSIYNGDDEPLLGTSINANQCPYSGKRG